MPIQVTYDEDADAMYVYLTPLIPGHADKTVYDQPVKFDLDSAGHIISFRLRDSENVRMGLRLEHAARHENVIFNKDKGELTIAFLTPAEVVRTIDWSSNVDFDSKGQIIGFETLFGTRFVVKSRLRHIRRFRI